MTLPTIGMFLHSLDDRAVSRLVLGLTDELHATGADVRLICADLRGDVPARIPAGIVVRDLRVGSRSTLLGSLRLARLLRADDIDVLFAHGSGPARAAVLARLLARTRTKLVVVEHTHYSTFFTRRRRLRDWTSGALLPRADRVAGVSEGVVSDLERRFPSIRGRTVVLPSPGPDPAWLAAHRPPPPDHPWYQGSDRPRLVCSVANIVRRKGQDSLVRALPLVREQVGDVRLVLVGRIDDRTFRDELEHLAADAGVGDCVSIVGYRDDAMPFIAHADVFVSSSLTEGFGMVLLEAMAVGVPVVSTDCPAGPRFVLDDGRCGVLVPVSDPPAMARAVAGVLLDDDLRLRLIDRGTKRATSFSRARVAQAYADLARELCPTVGRADG